jgi:GDSL-like Lipase/Acylhydrolase family
MKPNAMAPRPDAMQRALLDAPTAQSAKRTDARAPTWLERRWSVVGHGLRAAAVCALLAAIALHPAFISRYISVDGRLEEGSRELLYVLEGLAALVGVTLLILAKAGRQHSLLKEKIALGVAFSLTSVLGCILIMEGGLRLVHGFGRPLQASRHYFFAYDPVLGWRHRPEAVATFKNARVAINSAGLRDDELRPAGNDIRSRILFLGDSQVFGDGVSHEETFVERLQSERPDIDAINAGVIGYGTDQQLLYYERDRALLSPKVTIVGINAYDLRDNISTRVRSGYQKPVFEIRGDALTLTNVPVDPGTIVDRAQRWLNGSSHLYASAAQLVRRPGARVTDEDRGESRAEPLLSAQTVFPPPRQISGALEVTRLILARLAADARDSGGRFAVMFLPYAMDLGEDPEYRQQAGRFVAALETWGKQEGYPVLDLRDTLRSAASRDLFLDAMHFNADGHQLVARATGAWLTAAGLVPALTETR